MKVELILVIELTYNNQEIQSPNNYPYWENQDIWYQYHNQLYKKAGFKDEFKPYLKGSPFFEPKEITDRNLKKLVLDYTEVFRENEMEERECTNPFYGGYVLRINQEDKYFPQCCGDLGDIKYWENVSNGIDSYQEGHPKPILKFKSNKVIFDFWVGKYDEAFEPTPPENRLEVDLTELGKRK